MKTTCSTVMARKIKELFVATSPEWICGSVNEAWMKKHGWVWTKCQQPENKAAGLEAWCMMHCVPCVGYTIRPSMKEKINERQDQSLLHQRLHSLISLTPSNCEVWIGKLPRASAPPSRKQLHHWPWPWSQLSSTSTQPCMSSLLYSLDPRPCCVPCEHCLFDCLSIWLPRELISNLAAPSQRTYLILRLQQQDCKMYSCTESHEHLRKSYCVPTCSKCMCRLRNMCYVLIMTADVFPSPSEWPEPLFLVH